MKIRFIISTFIFLLAYNTLPAADLFPYQAPKNFSFYMEKPVVDHPVTTNNPTVQRYFNQGLTLIYAFNHDTAYWSFSRAAEQDPNLAMAYWGMALSLGTNINIKAPPEREKKAFDLAWRYSTVNLSLKDD